MSMNEKRFQEASPVRKAGALLVALLGIFGFLGFFIFADDLDGDARIVAGALIIVFVIAGVFSGGWGGRAMQGPLP